MDIRIALRDLTVPANMNFALEVYPAVRPSVRLPLDISEIFKMRGVTSIC